jgi:hypothetical protein
VTRSLGVVMETQGGAPVSAVWRAYSAILRVRPRVSSVRGMVRASLLVGLMVLAEGAVVVVLGPSPDPPSPRSADRRYAGPAGTRAWEARARFAVPGSADVIEPPPCADRIR